MCLFIYWMQIRTAAIIDFHLTQKCINCDRFFFVLRLMHTASILPTFIVSLSLFLCLCVRFNHFQLPIDYSFFICVIYWNSSIRKVIKQRISITSIQTEKKYTQMQIFEFFCHCLCLCACAGENRVDEFSTVMTSDWRWWNGWCLLFHWKQLSQIHS